MRLILALILVVIFAGAIHALLGKSHVVSAQWDGQRFVCPAGTDTWADETEAIEGKDYVYCTTR